ISSIAAVKGMPILLVTNNKLSASVESYVAGKNVYAVGGTDVLSPTMTTATKVTRLSGDNRYDTNAAILAQFPQDYSKIYLAKGTKENLVDALTGSALAALGNFPIVLVDGNSVINTNQKAVIKTNISVDSTQVLLGGTVTSAAAVSVEALKPLALQVVSIE
ncbi:cell wall-binding repeat-containing protein, partial [Clostridium sp.]